MIWYEMHDPKIPPIKMYCPVCQKESFLGKREKNQLFIEHCDDCKATYTWQPNEELPTALLDSIKKHKYCGCGNCKK